MQNIEEKKTGRYRKLLKKLGVAGLLFFLIKGLIWLAIFLGVAKYLTQ